MFKIESLLSARLFISPKLVDGRIYFISNMSGRLSLYVMDYGGSVPEPLLPSNLALPNPHLIGGEPFVVFPKLGKILIMVDRDGDEQYKPTLIPLNGGFPEPIFEKEFSKSRVHLGLIFPDQNTVFFGSDSTQEPIQVSYRANIENIELIEIGRSAYGAAPVCSSKDFKNTVLFDGYTIGDTVVFLASGSPGNPKILYGKPLEEREQNEIVPLNGIAQAQFVDSEQGLLMICAVFDDQYGLAYLDLNSPGNIQEVRITGLIHTGEGELVNLSRSREGFWLVEYNIDGCSWLYEGRFIPNACEFHVTAVLVGATAPLMNGMLQSYSYDSGSDKIVVSYSRATSPTQIITIEGQNRESIVVHTRERVLGIDPVALSEGEDASYISYDGLRISARLYLPADHLPFLGPRPVVFYVHGGPQSQERPDFAWFSMPLIQFLTLNGFAVFVPNVRGSTGYGLSYTKFVDRDWGGRDLDDHISAFNHLVQDPRLDTTRAGVVGRSYGGYMTLMLAGTHPELWSSAVDMFGPFDLLTFLERIPETWKPYYKIALGDEEQDREFLIDRSPKTHIGNITCPLLVIQGKNDPRVVEPESRDLVEYLRGEGKRVDYLMFENEGHDVLKYENRVRCYSAITEFFRNTLKP
jgi:pimeloyl-ACP methyl ester carboxylesterase